MKLTREILVEDGWKIEGDRIGVVDGLSERIFIKDRYVIRLGLFDCIGVLTDADNAVFFAWHLTAERYFILMEGLDIK